jgi:hypothetical protein
MAEVVFAMPENKTDERETAAITELSPEAVAVRFDKIVEGLEEQLDAETKEELNTIYSGKTGAGGDHALRRWTK